MSHPVEIRFVPADESALSAALSGPGRVVLLIGDQGRPIGRLPRGLGRVARRALASSAWGKVKPGESIDLAFPMGMEADAVQLVHLPRSADVVTARKAGAAIGARMGKHRVTVLAGNHPQVAEVARGIALRGYDFTVHKSNPAEGPDADVADTGADQENGAERAPQTISRTGAVADAALGDAMQPGGDTVPEDTTAGPVEPPEPDRASVTLVVADADAARAQARDGLAAAAGVFLARDLVNEPANVLTTTDFAERLLELGELGMDVEVLDEDALSRLGMRALLAVGQGSETPSAVVVMRWQGGGDEPPLALVGKGVVFDTGGISIKPSAGMEEMTMDMGGAAVVAGVMRTLALRRARANVVGLVGLVENMPDGRAQRPGDIVRSMKGDTIEVINTDAEGRLVLADVLWYAQDRFEPAAVIDLATLTGAVIIALGHDHAGVFSNDDGLADQLLKAAAAEGEGAWRLPLAPAYDELIKSRLADVKNTGGRAAGSITAAQFLQRFIRKGTPWAHIDIAGVTLPPGATPLAPKGATGWGVMTLDRLIRDGFEQVGSDQDAPGQRPSGQRPSGRRAGQQSRGTRSSGQSRRGQDPSTRD
ncbi:leucyl aminopeptidase [uncultured Paracoccus sp.]|uniref:leucyl aminopeptidase n=1 Tax=uncultured Paracoccus sp. TaxID=189685 RepID=UPI002636B76D|nr:leucyl aminopeptidase [uncultured Paracoccus sp.]